MSGQSEGSDPPAKFLGVNSRLAPVRLGPHLLPTIECGQCGTEHHRDTAASGFYPANCRECGAFIRRPTEAEEQQFGEFLFWNGAHMEREWEEGSA